MTKHHADNRRKEIFQLKKDGKSIAEIADEVGLSYRQVQFNLNGEDSDPDKVYRSAWHQMKLREQVPEGYFDVYERMNWLI